MTELELVEESRGVALVDQLERQLAVVGDAADAEQFWRIVSAADLAARVVKLHEDEQLRYAKLKLRAERRWGELLPPPKDSQGERSELIPGGKKLNSSDTHARHRAREVAAVPAAVFTKYVDKAKDPELLRRARLLRIAREARATEAREESVEAISQEGDIEIRHGDFRESLADLAGRVAAIVTDPPYAREYLHLYPELAAAAATLLKSDGSLVVLCGTRPDAWLRLIPAMEKHIPLRWVGCYLAGGAAWRDHQAHIATNWKPVLIFGGERNLNSDVWRSRAESAQTRTADVEWHKWGQNLEGFRALVSSFSDPGDLIVDPFVGGGTTALAAQQLGRRFVGCDTDAFAIATTRERLAA